MKLSSLTAATLLALACSATTHAAPLGKLDPSFSGDGWNIAGFGTPNDLQDNPFAQVIGQGGSTYVIGTATIATNPTFKVLAIAKFQPNGSLDPTYGSGGRVLHALPETVSDDGGAALSADGSLIVGTTFAPGSLVSEGVAAVCRFTKTGKIDSSFATAGCMHAEPNWLDPDSSERSSIRSLVVRQDGTILVGGNFAQTDSIDSPAIAAILSDGSGFDASFGLDGIVHFPELREDITGLKLTSLGSAMGVSRFYDPQLGMRGALVKVNAASGAPANNFGTQGVLALDLPLVHPNQRILSFDVSGSGAKEAIFIAGRSDSAFSGDRGFFGKLSASGSLDPQFANGGIFEFGKDAPSGGNVCAIKVVSDGIIIGGSSSPVAGNPNWSAAKFDFTGKIRPDFGLSGQSVPPLTGEACYLGLQGSRLMMSDSSGGIGTMPKPKRFHIARLDHGLATSFQVKPAAGANGSITPSQPVMTGHSNVAEFKIVPKPGFRVAKVVGCGNGELIGSRYRTAPVTAACSVTATFEEIPFAP